MKTSEKLALGLATASESASKKIVDASRGIQIKITNAWLTKEPVEAPMVLQLKEMGIPGFPQVPGYIMGFHADSALNSGPLLYKYAQKTKADCRFMTIATRIQSDTQKTYSDVLKTDINLWPSAGAFHLGKAKNQLKEKISEMVLDFLLQEGRIKKDTILKAEEAGFEHLLNVDPSVIGKILLSSEFPNLKMLIAPIKPSFKMERETFFNIAIAHPSCIESVEVRDVYQHKVIW